MRKNTIFLCLSAALALCSAAPKAAPPARADDSGVQINGAKQFPKEDIQKVLDTGSGISGPGKPWVDDGKLHGTAELSGILPPIKPLYDIHMRDTSIILGGDGNYYLTGSSGDNIWNYNDGIELWKSPDLQRCNGGTGFFKAKDGFWYTGGMGGQAASDPWNECPGIVRVDFAPDGTVFPAKVQPDFILIKPQKLATQQAESQSLAWVSSTDQARWAQQSAIPLLPDKAGVVAHVTAPDEIFIDPLAADQQITGWGGCFNELGWKALLTLPRQEREGVLKALFDPKTGLRFNLCRCPIGASDFALDGYSLDDVKDDYTLKHFSIDRDKKLLIPYIKAAMQYQPNLKVWASPWSPPGWMKDNGVYHGGHLRMEPRILNTYAHYLARFAQDYHKQGIDLYAVHVQNEPVSSSNYPTCKWENPEPLRDFIRDYMGPTFVAEKMPAQIWLGTMSEKRMPWFRVIFDDPGAAKYLSGIGLQYDGRFASQELHDKYPQFPLIETETPCGGGSNSWKDAERTFTYMNQFISGGCRAYSYWNMVLDQTGLSTWNWRQNSTIIVDTQTHAVTYTPEFYLMKHFSAYVPPGAFRLKTAGGWSDVLAFKNPDGKVVAIVVNPSDTAKPLTLTIGTQTASATIPAHSFNTFVTE